MPKTDKFCTLPPLLGIARSPNSNLCGEIIMRSIAIPVQDFLRLV
ncbi:hypothetical protein [Microcoleus sp. CAWBG58]|nr:hypothetical protein [Microcoleus sp. CAWBG58]